MVGRENKINQRKHVSAPQMDDTFDIQVEITQAIRMLDSANFEELTETNVADFQSALEDAIMQRGMDWTVNEDTNSRAQYTPRQQLQVISAMWVITQKTIPIQMRMEFTKHRISGQPHQINADVRRQFTGTDDTTHRRLEMQ